MNDGFLKMFKFNVPNQKKAFRKLHDISGYGDLTYRKFRNENVELDILSNYIECMNNEKDLFDPSQIKNLFIYLSRNIKGGKLSEIKKAIFRLYGLEKQIVKKIIFLENNKEKNKMLINNLNMVLSELKILIKIIIDSARCNAKELERQLEFEALARSLILPDSYEDSILQTLYYNSKTLNNSPNNSKVFSELLYNEILKCNVSKDYERKKYYVLLGNYLMETNLLKLDRKVINALGLRKASLNFTSSLEQKIKKMDKDENTGRYIVDDYILSFDNSTTSRYDDALSIETTPNGNYILGIHIADVHMLNLDVFGRVDHALALEEKSRASLKEYRERDAISLFVEISPNGLIVDKSFLMTKIEVNKNLYYNDFSKIIEGKNNTPMSNTVINLAALYQVLQNDRLPRYPAPSEMAHEIVHKYMLLYGCIASKYAEEKNIPILYHGDDKHVSINKTTYYSGFDSFDTYSRMTSPIWDLEAEVNQLSLCECIFEKLSNRERHNMKMNLLMAGNHINNNSDSNKNK